MSSPSQSTKGRTPPPPTPAPSSPTLEPTVGTVQRALTEPAISKSLPVAPSSTATTSLSTSSVASTTAPVPASSSAPPSSPAVEQAPTTSPLTKTNDPPPKAMPAASAAPIVSTAPTTSHASPTIAPPTTTTPVLNVPDLNPSGTRSRSGSSNTVQRPVQRVDTGADLVAHVRSRSSASRSDSGVHVEDAHVERPTGLPIPVRPGYGRTASSSELKSGLASPVIPSGAVESLVASIHRDRSPNRSPAHIIVTEVFAGSSRKSFGIHKELLLTRVPYFRKLFAFNAVPTEADLTFEDLDEYGFALFVRWLYGGALHGPQDFHTMQHYMSLYILAHRFDVEPLCNIVMDVVRAYYRQNNMTAPSYRVEYIYTCTGVPNHMRNFLITTAAYRCLCETPIAPGVHVSDSMKTLLAKGGDMPVDFAEALIKLNKNGIVDVRRGSNCTFHEHSDGRFCRTATPEPWAME